MSDVVQPRWSGRVALVTGASSGIGAAVADQLVQMGMKVIGCAPDTANVERIQKTAALYNEQNAAGSLHEIQCDVSKEDEILSMFAEIKKKYGGVDVCINNAGVSHPASIIDGKTNDWKHMLDVNVVGVCMCIRESYNSMKEKKIDDGHIINICSLAGHRMSGVSSLHMYSVTKHAVKAVTEAVRQELNEAGSHIRVTQISPGVVQSEFYLRMYPDDPSQDKKVYENVKYLEPKDIADAVIYALQTPPHVQVHDVLVRSLDQDT